MLFSTFYTLFARLLTLEQRLEQTDRPDRLPASRAFDQCRGLGGLLEVLADQKPLITVEKIV